MCWSAGIEPARRALRFQPRAALTEASMSLHAKPSNPWRRLASSLKYGNKWFSVREDDVIGPDGQRGTYSVVTAERIATGIVALWPDDSVTLVGQFRYAVNEYSWEIPEGGGPLDVDPLETAKRELQEEAGLTAGTWLFLGRVHTSNCFVNEVCHVYLATELSEGGARPDPEEVLQTQRVPFDRAIAMICDGSITDAITIAGLFWATLKRSPPAARRR